MVAGIAVSQATGEVDQVLQVLVVPQCREPLLRPQRMEMGVGVVDEGAELVTLAIRHAVGIHVVHQVADNARAVVEDVIERLILAVKVAHKVLGALGQVENGGEIDDLAR